MSVGPLLSVTNVGAGTLAASTGSALATASPNSSTQPGQLVVAVCYMAGDATAVSDAGDGWVFPDRGYDSANGYGIFIALLRARRAGAAGYAGITLPASVAWTMQTYTFAIVAGNQQHPFLFAVEQARGSIGWFNATASAQALGGPAIITPYGQVLDLVGRGYNNGGTTTTAGNITGYTERFDTGQASPPHGVVLNQLTTMLQGAIQNASVTSNLTVAKTNRAGVRCMVPIVGKSIYSGRYMSSRRIIG